MKSQLCLIATVCGLHVPCMAGQQEFCVGFAEGYRAVKGDAAPVPLCPVPGAPPAGSTDLREGVAAGLALARRVPEPVPVPVRWQRVPIDFATATLARPLAPR